ncbi:MAG: hypothetical protein IJZ82_10140 [Lachnospiraceae bacterium]|nr:hypothetical protein [Lachnospiraceae bacterium]
MIGKQPGQIGICVGMFLCMIVLVAVLFQIKLLQYHAVSVFVEDSLAASNLASAVIDVEEYGMTHNILVESPESAFYRYREALVHNLKLDENLYSTREEVLCGKVDILSYQVFNVIGDTVWRYRFDEGGRLLDTVSLDLGTTYLPDGNKLETTSVYSKVGFYVMGLGGETIYGTREKSVDIKREEE